MDRLFSWNSVLDATGGSSEPFVPGLLKDCILVP